MLGPPASFGPLTPGVAREYTAATNATVTSTAGDATLAVEDPGTPHERRLQRSLQPLRVAIAPAAWSGPVSNGRPRSPSPQAIAADEPLRTGTYSRTLVLTLSTTSP